MGIAPVAPLRLAVPALKHRKKVLRRLDADSLDTAMCLRKALRGPDPGEQGGQV